jgi:hypothetical protein
MVVSFSICIVEFNHLQTDIIEVNCLAFNTPNENDELESLL